MLFKLLILISLISLTTSFRIEKLNQNLLINDSKSINNQNKLNRLKDNLITTLKPFDNKNVTTILKSTNLMNNNYCSLNCTCLLIIENNNHHNDSELILKNNCLYLNLSRLDNRNEFKLFNQYHPFQLKDLKILNLSKNNLTNVDENLVLNFKHYNQLIELNLSKNKLTKFPKLKHLTDSLKQLNLFQNKISSLNLTKNDFYPFNYLEYLNLNLNRIKLIRKQFMKAICTGSRLKYLHLSSNKLKKLDDQFEYCKDLEILNLSNNKLSRLAINLFSNQTNLIELDLSNNNLTNLTIDFKSLTNLKILNLSKNKINFIEDGKFENLNYLKTLNLNENNLMYLDFNFVKGLKSLRLLQLSNNNLKYINTNWLESRNILNLYLEHNQIEKLNSTTFKGLINLEKLYLDYNLISAIEKNTFLTNNNLIWLFLNDNYLNSLVEQNRTLFIHNKLQYLALENNHITFIPNQLFSNLTSLITIDLSLNEIRFIEENALIRLNKLDELNWDSRSIDCDCGMKWFVNYYQEKSIENIYLEQLECKNPKTLSNKSFIDVNINLFLCKEDYKHYFLREPKRYQIVNQGKSFYLKCKVITNSYLNEDIIFEWRKNNQKLSLNNEHDIVEIMYLEKDKDFSINHKLIYSSYLHFLNATLKDEGDYYCIANNSYATIQSRISKVQLSRPPEFVSNSVDHNDLDYLNTNLVIESPNRKRNKQYDLQEIKEYAKEQNHLKVTLGSDIKIDVRAIGYPIPKISLHKKDEQNFTSVIKNRIQFDNNEQKFIIKNSTLEDQGVYLVKAINELGSVTKNITVDILSPPKLRTNQLNELEYFEGQTIYLDCNSFANPKASIIWKKDELLLEFNNDRYYLKSDNQILIIKNSKKLDGGTYECVLKNNLGIITSFRHVEILSANQLTLNYFYDNWFLILILICLIISSICLIKFIIVFCLKRFNKKDKYSNNRILNNHQIELNKKLNELNNELTKYKQNEEKEQNEKLLIKYNHNNQLNIDQNDNFLNDDPKLNRKSFSSIFKKNSNCETKLISFKINNSLDNLNNNNMILNSKLSNTKKVQFNLDKN